MISSAARSELPAAGERKPNGFELRPLAGGKLELKLWGRLPPGWAGALSAGLSRKGIGVIRGSATKVQAAWDAVFEVDPSRSVGDPGRIDFLGLAQDERQAAPAADLSLTDAVFGEPEQHNGAFYLEVRAEDQLGFLGALLNRMAFLSLFPEEMIIETENGRIYDRFWIRGIGGSTPSPASRDALRKKLGR